MSDSVEVPVRHRPREFSTVYRTSDDVPVPSKVEQHEAQVRARQLQETVKLHDSDVAPGCGLCCWNDDTGDITCKEYRLASGPKALREVGQFPSIATAAPKAGVSWLADSGSESDLVSKGMLRDVNAQNCRAAIEEHRPKFRELVKEKIKELEFENAFELFASVASNPKEMKLPATPKQKLPLIKNGMTVEIRVFGMRSASVNAVTL